MMRLMTAACAVLFIFLTVPARADTTGVVRGIVTSGGKAVSRAAVALDGEGSQLRGTTRADGTFIFSQVPFGHYHLTVSNGHATRPTDGEPPSDADASLRVALGDIHEIANVGVSAHAGVGGSPVSVNTLSHAQIAASPNRDSLDRLVTTMPGIVRFSYNEPVAHGFHGLTYEIDGAPLPQGTSSEFAEIVDPKSIDSLEVLTGAFPAEYGGSRQGAVVNIVTTRLSDLAPGSYGQIGFGGGEYATALGSLTERYRGAHFELSLSANAQRSDRGLDAPTYVPVHDAASQSDQLLRGVFQLNARQTLSFDVSNQLAQFEIPINADPNNLTDPIVSVPGTDDVQREYDRFYNLNYTAVSRDGDGVFQLIPWVRVTRVAYAGDLANDVLATGPQVGLIQDRRATYDGIRISQSRSGERHSWKAGLDASREYFAATQVFACYASDCNTAPATPPPPPPAPGYYAFPSSQGRVGSQIGLYAQDKWQPAHNVAVNAGIRYDRSTGYTSGWQISPRIGVNISDGGRNILHVYYGRLYAAPQLEDVRRACVLLNGCTGEPAYDLQPERDAYVEFGVQHAFNNHMHGYVNLFQKSVVNVLDTTQFLNTPLFAVFNNAIGFDKGIEMRVEDALHNGNSWFVSATVSGSYAGGVSGSTFLFPPNPPDVPLTSPAQLAPEDHDQTVAATASFTQRFGTGRSFYATMQANYGTGYPVSFENAQGFGLTGRLPSHLTLDTSLGRSADIGRRSGLGFSLDVENLLNRQYIIKIANGFNTTQISTGRRAVFRVTAPF